MMRIAYYGYFRSAFQDRRTSCMLAPAATKRLRILVYLPNSLTELGFRQAIGRVVRTMGNDDDTRAYVVMPSFNTFEEYARRIEDEMSPSARTVTKDPKTKRCAACNEECDLGDAECSHCGYQFPVHPQRVKPCGICEALNPISASSCHACGKSFNQDFTLTLDEALRAGAIVRGMDIDESDVRRSEEMAEEVRKKVLLSGDEKLVRILKALPDESWSRLRDILAAA